MNIVKVFGLAGLLAMLLGASARAEPWSWGEGPKPVYLDKCMDKRPPEERDRHRICSAYIQASFAQEELPDTALFLRERLIDLIDNYDNGAKFAYDAYYNLVLATLFLAVLGIGWTWWKGADAARLLVLSGISAVVISALSAFGYNTQFKAHFTAARNLTVVKDNIELELISAAKEKKPFKEDVIKTSLGEYKAIVAKHVEDFGGAFTPPTSILVR